MRGIVLPILSLLAVACSKEIDEVSLANNNEETTVTENREDTAKENPSDETTNAAPVFEQRSYSIAEHSVPGSSIGFLKASDTDEDPIAYILESDTAIEINETTGELTTGANLELDFENNPNIEFTVSAFDGKTFTEQSYTLDIHDVDETTLLTTEEEELISYFQHLAFWKGANHTANHTNQKWESNIQLYLEGTISGDYRTSVEEVIAEYNTIFADSEFSISLTDNSEEANANLFFGTKEEVADIWPDMYDIIKDGNYDGYAMTPFVNSVLVSTRIWISNPLAALFKHELGHSLGFGHSNKCEGEKSFLCSQISANSDILPIEVEVIRYLYHPDVSAGLTETEIEKVLANLILSER